MAKYAIFFTLKGESISHAMEHPSDRSEVMGKFAKAAGGKLEAYYWMLGGAYDGVVIADMPDSGLGGGLEPGGVKLWCCRPHRHP